MNSNCLIALHGSFYSDYLKMPKSYSIFLNINIFLSAYFFCIDLIVYMHIFEIKTMKMS